MPDQAINSNSRSASYAKKVLYKRKRWTTSGEKKAAEKTGQVGRAQRFYPVDQERRRFKTTGAGKSYRATQKLKEGIVPGSVLILLVGRYKGKRVVFLKQLQSGLLLVTGPHKINGVPLRRVNQSTVIPTSYKVSLAGVDASKINDDYFARTAVKAAKKSEEAFFAQEGQQLSEEEKKRIAEKKKTQATLDAGLLANIKKVELLRQYMRSRFTITNNMKPHELIF